MATPIVGIEQQIEHVRKALTKLRSMAKFRGKKALIRDTEKHLAMLIDKLNERDQGQDMTAVGAV
jgi:hypothetical protein